MKISIRAFLTAAAACAALLQLTGCAPDAYVGGYYGPGYYGGPYYGPYGPYGAIVVVDSFGHRHYRRYRGHAYAFRGHPGRNVHGRPPHRHP